MERIVAKRQEIARFSFAVQYRGDFQTPLFGQLVQFADALLERLLLQAKRSAQLFLRGQGDFGFG